MLPATPPTIGRELAGIRILLVDDNADALETFSYLLEHVGAAVTAAGSGAAALLCAAGQDFDLLVSDIGMPGMDGYTLLAQLRAQPRSAGLRAIALTGMGRSQGPRDVLRAGFQAHLDKPVRMDTMCATALAVLAGAPIASGGSDPF